MKIGIMGDKGSFSEEAAFQYIRQKKIKNYQIKYLITAANVAKELLAAKINLGLLPISNTTAGIVEEAVNVLNKHQYQLQATFNMLIKHFLLVKKGKRKNDIKKIVSHIQPLLQCKKYLQKNWPLTKKVEYSDTAKAAKDLSIGKINENCAVIAPFNCAAFYHLSILARNIQDNKNNITTFLVIKK